MSTDQEIEKEIQAKGLTAPRITMDDIEASIVRSYYFTAAQGVDGADLELIRRSTPSRSHTFDPISQDADLHRSELAPLLLITFCVMVLRNGHRIVGVNEGPVSAERFSAELGRKLARQKAVDQIWPLLGYELRSKLSAT